MNAIHLQHPPSQDEHGAMQSQNYYYFYGATSDSSPLTTTHRFGEDNAYPTMPPSTIATAVHQRGAPTTSSGFFNDLQQLEQEHETDCFDQYPSISDFEAIVQGYLRNLSPKKRDKALVDRKRYSLIARVLKDPRNTSISTAQFRFWVKKMFQLVPGQNGLDIVCHDNKPVAMREQIYTILVRAHKEANHGGRDKTSALVSHLLFDAMQHSTLRYFFVRFDADIPGYLRNWLHGLSGIAPFACLDVMGAKVRRSVSYRGHHQTT